MTQMINKPIDLKTQLGCVYLSLLNRQIERQTERAGRQEEKEEHGNIAAICWPGSGISMDIYPISHQNSCNIMKELSSFTWVRQRE